MEVQKLCCPHYVTINKARKDLGYEPIISFQEGMDKTVEFFKEREKARPSPSKLALPLLLLVLSGLLFSICRWALF